METGVPKSILYAGAGYAQLADVWEGDTDDWGIYFGDTTGDHYAVLFGMYLYEYYYEDDRNLTYAELLEALDNYEYTEFMDIVDAPGDFQPRYYDYPVNRFYNNRGNTNIRME
jgi:hypothetical protein